MKKIREVFVSQINEWFNGVVKSNSSSTKKIVSGFLEGKTDDIQRELTMFLGETISVLDTKARSEEKRKLLPRHFNRYSEKLFRMGS